MKASRASSGIAAGKSTASGSGGRAETARAPRTVKRDPTLGHACPLARGFGRRRRRVVPAVLVALATRILPQPKSSRRSCLLCLARMNVAVWALILLVGLAAGCRASTATSDVRFPNTTPGASLPIDATLVRPTGQGPFPAVVQLHGCAGLEPQSRRWARWLAERGYVAL